VVLLPQYPAKAGNRLPAFPMERLLSDPATVPSFIDFDDDGLSEEVSGFEGFEAIAFRNEDVFVTIESHTPTGMMGYLVRGRISMTESGGTAIKLDAKTRAELPARADLGNMTDESIVILPGDRLLTMYEANGANVVPKPTAYLFDISGNGITKAGEAPMEHIEYRVTDCTPADASGKFWCINYMFPGDEAKLRPAADNLDADRNAKKIWVERLLQLQFDGTRVSPAGKHPMYLKLDRDGRPRNWEGIAMFPGHGFFLVTDKFPETIFAFVEAGPARGR